MSTESTDTTASLAHHRRFRFRMVMVPVMLFVSSMLMATAWLGHLRFKDLHFVTATAIAWLIVLPEYMLNVGAVRMGKGIYSGATMASLNLCWGVICVVLVSTFYLGEEMSPRQYLGFGLMLVAMVLIGSKDHSAHLLEGDDPEDDDVQP